MYNNVEIRRPGIEDCQTLNEFFRLVITDIYAKEGLAELTDDMENEIETKNKYIEADLDSAGENRYFLLACRDHKIIGTIEYGMASKLIDRLSAGSLKELVEIGTVFVHPDYQGQGVGNLLLDAMYLALANKRIQEFCLDSGYKRAQKIWKKKFGVPAYLIKDYWSEGFDHMIWKVSNPRARR